jgi:hypothetical protein
VGASLLLPSDEETDYGHGPAVVLAAALAGPSVALAGPPGGLPGAATDITPPIGLDIANAVLADVSVGVTVPGEAP